MREKRHLPIQAMLEWAFGREKVQLELPDRRDHEERGFGFGMEHVLIERAKLGGVRIDGGGPRLKDSHEDAEAVAAVVSNLPENLGGRRMAVQVAECARTGLTPDWMPGAEPKLEPQHWQSRKGQWRGKPELLGIYVETWKQAHPKNKRKKITRQKKHEIWWTPCTWAMDPRTIEAAHRDYSAWRDAIEYIRDGVRNVRLFNHVVTDALPPARPWENRKGGSRSATSA